MSSKTAATFSPNLKSSTDSSLSRKTSSFIIAGLPCWNYFGDSINQSLRYCQAVWGQASPVFGQSGFLFHRKDDFAFCMMGLADSMGFFCFFQRQDNSEDRLYPAFAQESSNLRKSFSVGLQEHIFCLCSHLTCKGLIRAF